MNQGDVSATRVRIRDAAAEVLGENGYTATRLADIAERAGVRTPAIYHYYSGRDELIEDVVRTGTAQTHRFVTTTLSELPSTATAVDRIIAAVEAHLTFNLQISEYARASLRNRAQLPPSVAHALENEQRDYGRVWADLFDDAIEAGEIDPRAGAFQMRVLVVGALNFTTEWWASSNVSLEDLLSTTRRIVISGLGPQPKQGAVANRRRR